MRKGYVYVVLGSLILSVGRAIRHRVYIKKDFGYDTLDQLFLHAGIVFLIFVLPSLLLVRWYYKNKDDQK